MSDQGTAKRLYNRGTMAVNIHPPQAENLLSIAGVRLGIAKAHVRKPDRKDLLLIALDEGCHTEIGRAHV